MKTRISVAKATRRAIVFALLIAGFSYVCFAPNSPVCAFLGVARMASRGIADWEKKLSDSLSNALKRGGLTNPKRTHWAAITDPEQRRLRAAGDLRQSMDTAEETAHLVSSGASGVGNKTANRYGEILGSDRAVASAGDLDQAGKGLGRIAGTKTDDYADQFLDRQTQKITHEKTPGKPETSLAGKGFTEVEALNDVETLMGNQPPDGMAKLLDAVHGSTDAVDVGFLSELHSASGLRRRGETLESVATDQLTGRTPDLFGKKVDFLTNQAAYQNAATANAFRTKIQDEINELADAIIATESLVAPRKYKFCGSELV